MNDLALAQLALLLVLAAGLAGLWLSVPAAVVASMAAVTVFDIAFVPPRGSLAVDTPQQAALLVTLWLVAGGVGGLTARQRALAAQARREAARAGRLRAIGETLRASDDPVAKADALAQALAPVVNGAVTLLLAPPGGPPAQRDDAAMHWLGASDPDAEQRSGLWLCLRHAQAMGPGTGRHDEVDAWYLPLRGRAAAWGAALVAAPRPREAAADVLAEAQALCDQMGLALERAAAWHAAARARDDAQAQALSNTFLAAISHDYRTPLATILGAASSLQAQDDRLAPAQRRRLATAIADEARELDRMTTDTLQLARLGAPGVSLRLDWESAEEIVGTVLRHARRREEAVGPGDDGDAVAEAEAHAQAAPAAAPAPPFRLRAHVGADVPLLRCDATLLVQMLDNLVDNARKHAGGDVELVVRADPGGVLLAVRDRGPGIAPGARERVFNVFERATSSASPSASRGSGVGLAVCRAIARVHGGELTLRPRGQGGCSFECRLPVPPDAPELAAWGREADA